MNLHNALNDSHFSLTSCNGSALSTRAPFCKTFAQRPKGLIQGLWDTGSKL